MQARRPFGPDDVDKIVVHGSQATVEHTGWKYRPEGMTAAQLNLSYCVATLLLEGDVFVDQFSDDKVADPTHGARRKDRGARGPEDYGVGSKFRHKVSVTVHLNDGAVLQETVEAPRGSELNFPLTAEVEAKFVKLAGRVLPPAQVDKAMQLVLDMERLSDIGCGFGGVGALLEASVFNNSPMISWLCGSMGEPELAFGSTLRCTCCEAVPSASRADLSARSAPAALPYETVTFESKEFDR